ncbi:hypothetical protein [Kitasatospora sp. GAS204B]|uniref:hypothetical protein n=1 Tax=unclassified Kitasatospora TaxID=2633591 RepID=UPI0024771501|nr:hypothetical protein [Kitasatospora sp. GAS204B]
MKLRELERKLMAQGCTVKSDLGSHTKWICPCGRHQAHIPRHTMVSPGVVNDTAKKLACLPKGWIK